MTSREKTLQLAIFVVVHNLLVHLLTMWEVLGHRLFRGFASLRMEIAWASTWLVIFEYTGYPISARVTSTSRYVVTGPAPSFPTKTVIKRHLNMDSGPVKYCIEKGSHSRDSRQVTYSLPMIRYLFAYTRISNRFFLVQLAATARNMWHKSRAG